jgi:hypothetical protein
MAKAVSKRSSSTNTKAETQEKELAVSNSIKLDAQNPIPIEYNSNIFVDLKGKRYVPFLSPRDNFAQILIEAATLSNTNSACINSIARYVTGAGWYSKKGVDDKLLTGWAARVNRKGDSLNQTLEAIVKSYKTTGNAYIHVMRGGIAGRKFVRVMNRNVMDCRLSFPDDDNICTSVYISEYFRKLGIFNKQQLLTEQYPIYSPNPFDNTWWPDDKGFEHTIFHIKNDSTGYNYYGMPENIGCLPQQILEYKNARYNMDMFDNKWVIGGIVVVKDALSDLEAQKLGQSLIYQHTGDGRQGRFIIMASKTGLDKDVEIKEFNTQKEGSFIEFDQHVEEKIYVANNWNKLLLGGSERKGIGQGNSAYLRSVYDMANASVIEPMQQMLLEKFLNPLLMICDEWMGTKWSTYEIGLKTINPLSFLGDINVNSIITVNEARQIAGLEPMEDESIGKQIVGNVNTRSQEKAVTTKNEPDNVQD